MQSPASPPILQGPELLEYLEAVTRGADALLLSGGIAHELSNALQTLVLVRSTADDPGGLDDADLKQALDTVTERLTEAVTALRELSRPPIGEMRPVIVRDLLQTVDQWQQYQKLLPRVPVTFDVAPDLPAVRADDRRVRHALLALITNAKEAVGNTRGSIVVTATATRGGVEIAVEDDGAGMAVELGERAFQPFVTTKTDQPHRGLGLTVARLVVESSGGSLRVDGRNAQGARLVVRLQEWQRSTHG